MARFQPPNGFDFSRPELWPDWKQRWRRFHSATQLGERPNGVQISSLIYAMGQEAETIYDNFLYDEGEDPENHNTVLRKFDDHFVPTVNVIHERAKFYKRQQQPGENVETYLRALYELSTTCGFDPDQKNTHIRDQLVVGILDTEISTKLQMEEGLTLARAIELCRTSEQVKTQIASQQATAKLDAVTRNPQHRSRRQHKQYKPQQRQQPNPPKPTGHRCNNCGLAHKDSNVCPAKGKQCIICKKYGHFRAVCRSRRRGANEIVEEDAAADEASFYLGAIDCGETKPWRVALTINNYEINFKADSGADIGCIPQLDYERMIPRPTLLPTRFPLKSPGGRVDCLGQFDATTQYKGQIYTFPICVIRGETASRLLGRSAAHRMGILKFIEEVSDDVFGEFGLMKGDPVRIRLKPDAQPYNLATPRRISAPLLKPLQEELNRMVANDIITPITEPTEWCSPIVVVLKKTGRIRLCVDYKRLNQSVMREQFIMPTVDEISSKLAGSTVFSALDCSQSFWQLPLHEDDRKYTCFITPFGRYVMNRLPYGLNSSTEILQRRLNTALEDIPGVIVDVDDMLIYARNEVEHDKILDRVLERIRSLGLKLNKSKCKFRVRTVTYQGQVFTSEGMKPDPAKVKAIKSLAPPQNPTEVRRFCGMVKYLGRYTPDLSTMLQPIQDLTREDTDFVWDTAQQQAFDKVKDTLSSGAVLKYYDMSKPTYVSADASGYGLGACLMQEFDNKLHPIAFASRALTDTEKRWAQIEKECLALVWACEKFSHFLIGLPKFRLVTDHKPLVPLINTKDLDRTPIRVQRLLIRLMRFNCVCEHVPGKTLVVADALSRSNVFPESPSDLADEVQTYVENVERSWPVSDQKIRQIAVETSTCPDLSLVYRYTLSGWPEYAKDVPETLQSYFAARHCLSTVNGVLTYLNRIVIPASLRNETLARLHAGHQGVTKSRDLANTSVWWPTINIDIQETCNRCQFCEEHKPAKPNQPLMPTPLPDGPWQKLGADICEFNKQQYLVVVDYYSRYIELLHLPDMTSKTLVYKFKSVFARHGVPYCVRTDNARSFKSEEFARFTVENDVEHEFSSPHFPQSNGAAEAAVKIAKKCLRQEDPFLALMMYRSTPHSSTGYSPAELLFGRKLRTGLPALPATLQPSWPDANLVREKDACYKRASAKHYDKSHGVREYGDFKINQPVRIKTDAEKLWQPATITAKLDKPRSYNVVTENGKLLRRNSKHIMPSYRPVSDNTFTSAPTTADVPASAQPLVPTSNRTATFDTRSPVAVKRRSATTNSQIQHRTAATATTTPVKTVETKTRSGRIVNRPQKLDL